MSGCLLFWTITSIKRSVIFIDVDKIRFRYWLKFYCHNISMFEQTYKGYIIVRSIASSQRFNITEPEIETEPASEQIQVSLTPAIGLGLGYARDLVPYQSPKSYQRAMLQPKYDHAW